MLLLIHDRDRWELPPEPPPEPSRRARELRLPRLTRTAAKVLLAVVLFLAAFLVSGLAADVLLLVSLVAIWSAIAGLFPYGLGLKEHHQ